MHQEKPSKARGALASTYTRADSTTIFAIALALPLVLLSASILFLALASGDKQPLAIASRSPSEPATKPPSAAAPSPPANRDVRPSVQAEVPPTPILSPSSDESAAPQPTNPPTANPSAQAEAAAPRPIVEGYNPETYSLLSDLNAAIASGAWQDAGQIITSPRAGLATGVAPDVNDKSHLTTLPIAIQLAYQKHPQIRAALGDRFAALARLRVAEAIESADAARLGLAIAQFPDTPAAVEAHQWLADQALADGSFAAAIDHYEQAAKADTSHPTQPAPRLRLARALLGRDSPASSTGDVSLGETALAAAEFNALLTELKASHVAPSNVDEPVDIFPVSFEKASPRLVKLDSPDTADANRPLRHHSSANHTLTLDDEALYVCTPLSIQAYDLTNGHLRWHYSPDIPSDAIRQNATASRPLIAAERIYLRLPNASGQRLVCLDKSTGKLLWETESRERERILTAALVVEKQLVALGVESSGNQQCTVRHYVIDRRTGRTLSEQDVVQPRSNWSEQGNVELTPSGPHLIAAFSGATISLDVQGNLRWVRMSPQVVTTHSETPRPGQRLFVQGGQAFLHEPESNAVLALDADTGRLLWRSPLSADAYLAGVVEKRLIVGSPDNLRGLATDDGSETWQQATRNAWQPPLFGSRHLLLGQHLGDPSSPDQSAMRLTWIDATTGEIASSTNFPAIETGGAKPQRLLVRNGCLWCYLTNERGDHALLDLVPAKQAARFRPPAHQVSSSPFGR